MKYLILGAGPAGLAFATQLLKSGEYDFLILEKEKEAGGLCRSINIDEAPLDIGGGHFIDIKRKNVLEMLFDVMPESEWNLFQRNSQIDLYGVYIHNPIEANIWQLPIDEQVVYLKSIALAGCNINEPIPDKFVEWINWKLGDKIADNYMLPYNKKMFGNKLNELGIYWLEKLPNVSFDETLISCLKRKAYGSQPAHSYFYYPKSFGSGEVWKRLAQRLEGKIVYETDIKELDIINHTVNQEYSGDKIVNTIPWTEFSELIGVEEDIRNDIAQLKHTSMAVDYFSEKLKTDAHWIYIPDEKAPYHRILVRGNFIKDARGYWTETNTDRLTQQKNQFRYINKYAYPLNTINKPKTIRKILDFMKHNEIYGLGRWGEWEHYNSDVVVDRAITLADLFISK